MIYGQGEDEWTYTIELERQETGRYSGEWHYWDKGELVKDHAYADLFTSEDMHLLFGGWHEDQDKYTWWVQLDLNDS